MRAVLAALALASMVLAGCASGDDAGTQEVAGDAPAARYDARFVGQDPPPGCDPEAPAFVHTAGGAPVAWDGPVGIPCLVATGWGTGEPSLGVTSDGTLFIYPAFQAPAESLQAAEQFTGMGIARSADQGRTFDRLQSEVAGAANWHPYTADPFMYVDPYTDRVFMEDLLVPPFNCASLSYSDDLGASWTQGLGGCLVWDHVGYGSGPSALGDASYPVVIQRCAITLLMTTVASEASGCQKTLDGGASWEPPGDPAFFGGPDGLPYVPTTCHGAVHHVFVDHRGWTWLGRDWCGSGPWVALSKDEGATWTRSHVDGTGLAWHDVGVGADAGGTAYAFWISPEDRPLLAVSHDDGASWSDPMDIAPPGVLAAGNANLAPAGHGKAGFSYAAEVDGLEGVHPVLAAGYGLDTPTPVFQSAIHPEAVDGGICSGGLCDGQADFLDATVAADGTVWGSYASPFLAAGRLWGAPSLWDDADPDGVYHGWLDGATGGSP